jgi:hypothetical protein
MILPLLHERSCQKKKKITHHSNNNKRTWKKKHPPQQQQRNEPRKQTPTTTTTTTTKNLENKHPPQQITQHHHHNNNNKRKLEKRIFCLSGKFSRIYAQELQDEQASAMVNELHHGLGLVLLPSHISPSTIEWETKRLFTIVTHNSHYVNNHFLPFFWFLFTTMSDFFGVANF